ncbi:hypothetical protein N0V93_003218 [Gnomoniopsis smithogilvyi]|uniref:Rhodopsin domain-containing protein n=1 Tax=Gnomoniopsis smithogilvyi TaxID=1191159 RepID=A0A9W9CYX8_9PEZI|nr:hypothetical protein N0V93_003218 [Gnomoniopsis smithogilvyi]
MNLREKVAVGFAMSMGIFAALCAVIKCTHLPMLSNPDFTYELSPIVIWSAAEASATIMAACVPSLRVLARTARSSVKHKISQRGKSMNTPYGSKGYIDKASTQASTITASLANTRPELRSRLSFERWAMGEDGDDNKAHLVLENVIHVDSVIRLDWEPVPMQMDAKQKAAPWNSGTKGVGLPTESKEARNLESRMSILVDEYR